MAALDPAAFRACFSRLRARYAETSDLDVVAVDGKTSRRAHNRNKGIEPPHLLTA